MKNSIIKLLNKKMFFNKNLGSPRRYICTFFGLLRRNSVSSCNDAKRGNFCSPFTVYRSLRPAFTLAEVLITLVIVGVVAAITIPTLINNAQKKDGYSKLLKAYSVITNVSNSIRSENGGELTELATTNVELANLFKPYMNVLKFCQDSFDSPSCYLANTASVYTLNGGLINGTTPYYFAGEPKMITTDGIMYDLELLSSNCTGGNYQRNGVSENCGTVFIDVNGAKPPNTAGKDLFFIQINKYNTTLPTGFTCDKAISGNYNGVGCAAKAITEGGIYYY